MGILDVIKRWFGGGKTAPAKPSPTSRTYQPQPAEPAPKPVQPVQLSAHEALDALAAKAAAKSPSGFTERRERPRVNARDGTRVLIIDDSPTIVALLKRMLEQNGYKAMEAVDAETGVALAISEKPDLIFLDIVLPGMNGFEALRRLRRDPATKTTPIVMISGNELATEQFYAQRIGADDFMKKPFSRSEVFARIEKLLDAEKVPRRHLAVVKPLPTVDGATATAAPATAAPVAAAAVAAVVAPAAPVAAAPAAAVPTAEPATVPTPALEAAPVETPVLETAAVETPVMETGAVATPAPAAIPSDAPAAAAAVAETAAVEPPAVAPVAAPVAQSATAVATPEAKPAPGTAGAAVVDEGAPVPAAGTAGETAEAPAAVSIESKSAESVQQAEVPAAEPVPVEPAAGVADAVAASVPAASADPSQTMIIEETLRAPANDDVRDPAPMPLAAVANVSSPSSPFVAGDAVGASQPAASATMNAVASMPMQASAQHTVSG